MDNKNEAKNTKSNEEKRRNLPFLSFSHLFEFETNIGQYL